MKYFAIVLIAVCLAACDYLPKNATLNLSPEQISQLQTQLQPSEQVVVAYCCVVRTRGSYAQLF